MNKSENIKNLAIALSKFQAEISNPKNTASNPFFKSKYAPLQDVLNLVRPLLSKYGLSIVQLPYTKETDTGVVTILIHESGEFIESDPLVLKAEKNTAQGAGSVITYARRYAVSAILGIASEEDDDGAEASGTVLKNEPKIGPNEIDIIKNLGLPKEKVAEVFKKYGYTNPKDTTLKDFGKILNDLQK